MQRKTLPPRRNPLALSAGALVVQAVFGTCAGAVLLALPSTARAQASTAADTSAQTIVITTTARKKSELAQEVPITMDVIGGREIKDSGITRVQDIQANVPGLVIDTLESSGRISLRGVGTGDLGLGTDQSVAIHVDGVYQVFGSAGLARFFDIDRVEVLRGPQGTLYGRNATAGVINLVSRAPQKKFGAEVDVSLGSFGTRKLQGVLNVPLSEDTAVRFALVGATSDGRITNTKDGSKTGKGDDYTAFRGSLRSRVGAVGVDLTVQHIDDKSNLGVALVPNPYKPALRLGTTEGDSFDLGYFDKPVSQHKKDLAVSLKLSGNVGDVSLTSITGYGKHTGGYDLTFSTPKRPPGQWARVVLDEPYDQWSQELQANFNLGESQWTTGLYYIDYKGADKRDLNQYNIPFNISTTDSKGLGKSYAAFADVNYPLSKQLRLNVGLRYTHDEKTGVSSSVSDDPFSVVNPPASLTKTWSATTGRLGLDYFLSKGTMIYGGVSTGYKSGGVAPAAYSFVPNSVYEPEKLTALEVGQKTTFAGGGGIFNVSVFNYDYKDKVEIFSPDGINFDFYNVPKARIKGIDGYLELRVARNMRWDLNAALLDAKFIDFPAFDFATNAAVNYAGNRPARAPKTSATTGLTMDKIPMFGVGMAQIRAEYVYRDKIYFTFQNQPDRLEKSLGLFNLSARLTSNDGRWSAYFAGRNLADKKYVANIIATPAGQFVVPAEGRTWQLGGTLSF